MADNVPPKHDSPPTTTSNDREIIAPAASSQRSSFIPPHDESTNEAFAPRPTYWEDRHEVVPMLHYFVRRDHAAEAEFVSIASDISFLLRQMEYGSYCVTYAHVGYEEETSLPCLLVIAKGFVDRDAVEIIQTLQLHPSRKVIARAFAFEGTNTEFSIEADEFRAYQKNPQPGSSVGSSASPNSSFSLNCYFRDQQETDDKVYSLTVVCAS